METVKNGIINFNTENRVTFSSTNLLIQHNRDPNKLDIGFSVNDANRASMRSIFFGMDARIVTGTYNIDSNSPLSYTKYLEYHGGPNGAQANQYDSTKGSVHIEVTRTAKTTRYEATKLQVTMKRSNDNELRSLEGDFTLYIDN